MVNCIATIKSTIAPIFIWVRNYLENLRKKNKCVFDLFSETVKFAIPFIGCFAPAFVTSTGWLMFGNLLLFSSLLTLQWATLTNKADRRVAKVEEEFAAWRKLYGEDEIEKIDKLNSFLFSAIDFSHLVSDKVKKLSTEIAYKIDGSVERRVCDFLQEGINSIEDLLTEHYQVNMRASIKLVYDKKSFKTYVRGAHNIESRGGDLAVKNLNRKILLIENNFAYDAIANKYLKFFAEGNLIDMHNKSEDDDVFFCEYENYLDYFCATFIMPIRIPEYRENIDKHEILGIVCVDCNQEINEWSRTDFKDKLCYHIVADYADSLALLLKTLNNANKAKLKSRENFERYNARKRNKQNNRKNSCAREKATSYYGTNIQN